jgi:hypothetical protein
MALICKITNFDCHSCRKSFSALYYYQTETNSPQCKWCGSIDTALPEIRDLSDGSDIHLMGISDWDNTEYNPGLGCVTRSRKHREQIAKERGLVEVGNEDVERVSQMQDRKLAQQLEARTEKSFEEGSHHLYEAVKQARSR